MKSLTAYVVERDFTKAEREEMARLEQELLQDEFPDYMVPKKFVFLEQMPMTNNGKADRKKLADWEEAERKVMVLVICIGPCIFILPDRSVADCCGAWLCWKSR